MTRPAGSGGRAGGGPRRAPRYAELHAHSAFSFLDGASHPEELAAEAARLGLSALAVTDHDGLYGVVRFATAARAVSLPTVFGAELHLPVAPAPGAAPVLDAPTGVPDPRASHLLVLARGPDGYRNLSSAIATAHLATGTKGAADYRLDQLGEQSGGQWLVLTGCRKGAVRSGAAHRGAAGPLVARARPARPGLRPGQRGRRDHRLGRPRDSRPARRARRAGRGRPPAARRDRQRPLRTPPRRAPRGGARGRARPVVARRHGRLAAGSPHRAPAFGGRDGATGTAATRRPWPRPRRWAPSARSTCASWPPSCRRTRSRTGTTRGPGCASSWTRGATDRYGPRGRRARARRLAADRPRARGSSSSSGSPATSSSSTTSWSSAARSGILAQGRGSAANSAVCYALGITAVDAVKHGLLFERFLAPERDGPPDIDVDIESVRREEVIQYVYERFGRTHAAQVANVISYRPKSAVRDAARALGYDVGQQDAWSKSIERWGSLRGPDPSSPAADRAARERAIAARGAHGSAPAEATASVRVTTPVGSPAVVTRTAAKDARTAEVWGTGAPRQGKQGQQGPSRRRADRPHAGRADWTPDLSGRVVDPLAHDDGRRDDPTLRSDDPHDVVPAHRPPSAADEGEIPAPCSTSRSVPAPPAAPRHPLGRHGHVRPARDRGVPGRVGAHGGAHGAAVGQGGLRRRGAGEVRPPGPGHAHGAPGRVRV